MTLLRSELIAKCKARFIHYHLLLYSCDCSLSSPVYGVRIRRQWIRNKNFTACQVSLWSMVRAELVQILHISLHKNISCNVAAHHELKL